MTIYPCFAKENTEETLVSELDKSLSLLKSIMESLSELRDEIKDMQETMERIGGLKKEFTKSLQHSQSIEKSILSSLNHEKNSIERLTLVLSSLKEMKEKKVSIDQVEMIGEIEKIIRDVKQHRIETASILPTNATNWIMKAVAGTYPFFLPDVNAKLKFKAEYEEQKRMFAYFMIVIMLICFFFPHRFLLSTFHFLGLYFYFAQSLREQILILNGSRIHLWWTVHHVFSISLNAFLLTWPDGHSYRQFIPKLIVYVAYASIVSLLQYRYQKARLYAKLALGRGEAIEPVDVETAGRLHWSGAIALLMPFLVLGQAFQLYNGYFLIVNVAPSSDEWQALVVGIHFIILGAGNLFTTIRAVWKQFFRTLN